MAKHKEKTIVVFRRWNSGFGIIALFPEHPSDYQGFFCDSYEHIGQHGGADYHGIIQASTPATRQEYADLKQELTRLGYRLEIRTRTSPELHQRRIATARRYLLQP